MVTKTKIFQSLRVSESSESQINLALKELNKQSIVPLTLADFRRLAYLYLARDIMSGKTLDLKLER